MEINSWGLFVRLVHDTNRSTKILSIDLYFNEVLESYKKLLYQESSLTCIKTQVWFCKQKYEVTSSVSYRCIERDKGVILCSFVQDNTNLGQTLQSAINPYFTDLRNNVILHLQWEKNVVSNTCFNNLHVKLWAIYTPYVKLFWLKEIKRDLICSCMVGIFQPFYTALNDWRWTLFVCLTIESM